MQVSPKAALNPGPQKKNPAPGSAAADFVLDLTQLAQLPEPAFCCVADVVFQQISASEKLASMMHQIPRRPVI